MILVHVKVVQQFFVRYTFLVNALRIESKSIANIGVFVIFKEY